MKHLILSIPFFIPLLTFSQIKSETQNLVIKPKVFGEDRPISVFLPDAYFEEESTESFAVAYLFICS